MKVAGSFYAIDICKRSESEKYARKRARQILGVKRLPNNTELWRYTI